MSKIIKFNEFLNSEILIKELIIELESKYRHHSDLHLIESDNDYERLLLSKEIIPFLIERIDHTNLWYSALSKLTNVNDLDFISKSSERKDFWKKWAKNNGY